MSDDKQFTLLQVGKPYIAGKDCWPERVEYNFRDGAHELRLFIPGVMPDEVRAVAQGPVDFGMARRPIVGAHNMAQAPLIFFFYQFGDSIPWSDAPYSWWMVPEDQRQLPSELDGVKEQPLLQIVLVESLTGIVRALRVVSLQPQFAKALHGAIRQQTELPFEQGPFDAALKATYSQFRTTDALMRGVMGLRQMRIERAPEGTA